MRYINRITVEFKYDELVQAINAYNDINRITVEFKFAQQSGKDLFVRILIESQWNLNERTLLGRAVVCCILIESQWNLKIEARFFLVDTLSYYSGSVVKTKSNIFIMN